MRTLLGVPMVAVLLAAMSAGTSQAACCGAASYKHVGCCGPGELRRGEAAVLHGHEDLP